MPMFGFDDTYPMFDVTPVDNQFILEYLPAAGGDAVRVYLYGLMQCYHRQDAMTIEQMGREINLTADEILTAYRYWERKGLVRRIADHPPVFRYVSVKQTYFMGGGSAAPVDEAYEAFAGALYSLFGNDRRLHGKEVSQCYEWVEDLGLPADVVLELIRHMIAVNGKKVAIKTIEKRAMLLAEEKVQTVEDAQLILNRDKAVWDGSCAVLRRLGKRRHPTEDEQALYRTWHLDWGFTQEDVLAACAETTKGEPTFAYLNGILSRLHGSRTSTRVADALQQEQEQAAPLKALLSVMKLPGVGVNAGTLAVYEDMRTLYPDNIILMAGQECARRGASFEDVMTTLKNWKRNGLTTVQEIQAYMRHVDDLNDFLQMLYDVLGLTVKPNAPDRRLAALWLEEFAFDPAFVTQCAAWAIGKEKPMAYLAALLEAFRKKNICTIEAAQQERESYQQKQSAAPAAPVRGPKTVEQQQYTQREYAHSEDSVDELMKKWQEEHGDA